MLAIISASVKYPGDYRQTLIFEIFLYTYKLYSIRKWKIEVAKRFFYFGREGWKGRV
jgi:hypothetical protein